jgi:hypothetical protein
LSSVKVEENHVVLELRKVRFIYAVGHGARPLYAMETGSSLTCQGISPMADTSDDSFDRARHSGVFFDMLL